MAAFVVMFALAIPGPLFPAFNTELILLYRVLELGEHPALVVAAASVAQMMLCLVLSLAGERTLLRWKFFAKRITALTQEKRDRFRTGATALLWFGATLGFPPIVILAVGSSSVGYGRLPLALIMLVGRVIRFSVLVALGTEAQQWLSS
jgi:membrane protein YqaA with SNARE-associated domain